MEEGKKVKSLVRATLLWVYKCLEDFARRSLFIILFLGISLREKRPWRLEGFSFLHTMQSLMASLITCTGNTVVNSPLSFCHI